MTPNRIVRRVPARLTLALAAVTCAAAPAGMRAAEPLAAIRPGARILFQGDSILGDEWERSVREFWK